MYDMLHTSPIYMITKYLYDFNYFISIYKYMVFYIYIYIYIKYIYIFIDVFLEYIKTLFS